MSSGPNVGVMIDGASFTATGFAGRYRCPQTSRRPANHPHTGPGGLGVEESAVASRPRVVMVEVLKGLSLLASGVVIALICSALGFRAGVRADLNQTGGQLSPVLVVGFLIGLVVSAVGAILLYRCYERARRVR